MPKFRITERYKTMREWVIEVEAKNTRQAMERFLDEGEEAGDFISDEEVDEFVEFSSEIIAIQEVRDA